MLAISRDLENEGIELSNEKISKILSALKQLIKVYYRVFSKLSGQEGTGDVATELQTALEEQLRIRTGLKEGIIKALCSSINTILLE